MAVETGQNLFSKCCFSVCFFCKTNVGLVLVFIRSCATKGCLCIPLRFITWIYLGFVLRFLYQGPPGPSGLKGEQGESGTTVSRQSNLGAYQESKQLQRELLNTSIVSTLVYEVFEGGHLVCVGLQQVGFQSAYRRLRDNQGIERNRFSSRITGTTSRPN